jgi:single-strand DNA-binding protein
MNGLNRCEFIGNLGRDPETSYSQAGLAITKFSIAVPEKWKDEERTEWVRITAFGKLAEICEKYLQKGKQIYVAGRMKTSSWEKDGITRYSTDIIADQMQMLGSKSENQYNADRRDTSGYGLPQGPGEMDDSVPF